MALILNTSTLPIDYAADALSGTITDTVVYGGAEPNRADVRVFITGAKMKQDGTVKQDVGVTSDTGDPETSSVYSFSIPEDGWFRFLVVIVREVYSAVDTYSQYEAVYNSVDDKVYRSKQSGNIGNSLTNTTWWEEITDPSTLALNKGTATESTNIDSLVYNRVLSAQSQQGYGDFVSKESNNCCGDCGDDTPQYKVLNLLINGLLLADQRTSLLSGEKIARRLESILESC